MKCPMRAITVFQSFYRFFLYIIRVHTVKQLTCLFRFFFTVQIMNIFYTKMVASTSCFNRKYSKTGNKYMSNLLILSLMSYNDAILT